MKSFYKFNNQDFDFIVIGAGLAGSEAALTLAESGARVLLFEQKPKKFSEAHRLKTAAELVCSNSLKSTELSSAHGLLKEELRYLDSPLLKIAHKCRVPGGKALSLDREKFSSLVSEAIDAEKGIYFVQEPIDALGPFDGTPTLVATGPLTGAELMQDLQSLLGEDSLYFYDATAPVVSLDSLDLSKFFWASRRQENQDDYLNLPLSKDEYTQFREQVLAAEKVAAHLPGEDLKFFEGCLPIEVLAERGEDTLAYSCMRPIGLTHPDFPKAHAVIQFRRERAAGELLSMVGFQTRMKWPEQERVFRSLPGMSEASFVRLGAMHRNSFINAPKHLNEKLQLKKKPELFFAGQITGSEGYTEALATGHYAALQMMDFSELPNECGIKSLVRFLIQSDEKHFQPMNFNFGLLPLLEPGVIQAERDKLREQGFRKLKSGQIKKLKNGLRSERSLQALTKWLANFQNSSTTFKTGNPYRLNFLKTLTEANEPISKSS